MKLKQFKESSLKKPPLVIISEDNGVTEIKTTYYDGSYEKPPEPKWKNVVMELPQGSDLPVVGKIEYQIDNTILARYTYTQLYWALLIAGMSDDVLSK